MNDLSADARAKQMRKENEDAFDNVFDVMNRVGLLLSFPAKDWDAYMKRHFGPDCQITSSIPPEPTELGWKDPHRTRYDSEDME